MGNTTESTAVGRMVREARTRMGLSAVDVGRKIGCHPSAVTKIERGRSESPSPTLLEGLAITLGLDLGKL